MPIWTEGDRPDPSGMSPQGLAAFAREYIPELDGLIETGTDQCLPIQTKTATTCHPIAMPCQGFLALTIGDRPEFDRLIDTATHQHLPIRAEPD